MKMKKIVIGMFLAAFGFILTAGLFAQPTADPPAPPENKGTNGDQSPPYNPSGSPLEPGTGILLLLAAGYGIKKVRDLKKA